MTFKYFENLTDLSKFLSKCFDKYIFFFATAHSGDLARGSSHPEKKCLRSPCGRGHQVFYFPHTFFCIHKISFNSAQSLSLKPNDSGSWSRYSPGLREKMMIWMSTSSRTRWPRAAITNTFTKNMFDKNKNSIHVFTAILWFLAISINCQIKGLQKFISKTLNLKTF